MNDKTTPFPDASPVELLEAQRIDDLFKLTLVDGLKLEASGKAIVYKVITLRETNVADERRAEALSERAVNVGGSWKLLVSESNFKHSLNMLHVDSFHCDDVVIPRALIDLAMYDRLSSHDLELIEQRIFLITLAAEVRYGNMSQADFDAAMAGTARPVAQAPQPEGQTPTMGAPAGGPESGPALLADYAGGAAQRQA